MLPFSIYASRWTLAPREVGAANSYQEKSFSFDFVDSSCPHDDGPGQEVTERKVDVQESFSGFKGVSSSDKLSRH